MEARLVYSTNGVDVELEKMEFEKLDEFTYSNFETEEDIINCPDYMEKIGDLPKDGNVTVMYHGFDMPISIGEYFAAFGNDIFSGEQSMSVLVKQRNIGTTKKSIRESIIGIFTDMSVVEEFHELFKDFYSSRDNLLYLASIVNENMDDALEGVKTIVDDAMDGSDGYFAGRIFIDGLSNFETVKIKEKKEHPYTSQFVKKN